MMPARRDMIDARRGVPGQEVIALAVAVVEEEITTGVEVEVVGIAESVGDDFRAVPIGIEAEQGTAFDLPSRNGRNVDLAWVELGVVAANDIPVAIRAFAYCMAAVFAGSEREQALRRAVGAAIAVRVAETPERAIAYEHQVTTVEAQTHAAGCRLGEI